MLLADSEVDMLSTAELFKPCRIAYKKLFGLYNTIIIQHHFERLSTANSPNLRFSPEQPENFETVLSSIEIKNLSNLYAPRNLIRFGLVGFQLWRGF